MPVAAVIRRAIDSDIEAVARLRLAFERITRDSGRHDEAARLADIAKLLARDLARGALLCWIAETDGRAVAQSAIRLRGGLRAGPREGPREGLAVGAAAGGARAAATVARPPHGAVTAYYGEVLNVYTEPAFRGRGLGSALVAAAIAEARALGLRGLVLQATDDSRGIYERAGFRASGRRMTLDLGQDLRPRSRPSL